MQAVVELLETSSASAAPPDVKHGLQLPSTCIIDGMSLVNTKWRQ